MLPEDSPFRILSQGIQPPVDRLCRSALAPVSGRAVVVKIWCQHLVEARRPEPHRVAQTQQHHWSDTSGTGDGPQAHHCRNRCRATRGSHCHRLCLNGSYLRGVHGRGRHGTSGTQRGQDAHAGRRGPASPFGQPHPQGCHQ
jgi:hypothetical protein